MTDSEEETSTEEEDEEEKDSDYEDVTGPEPSGNKRLSRNRSTRYLVPFCTSFVLFIKQ